MGYDLMFLRVSACWHAIFRWILDMSKNPSFLQMDGQVLRPDLDWFLAYRDFWPHLCSLVLVPGSRVKVSSMPLRSMMCGALDFLILVTTINFALATGSISIYKYQRYYGLFNEKGPWLILRKASRDDYGYDSRTTAPGLETIDRNRPN